jgi:hypothetical protein
MSLASDKSIWRPLGSCGSVVPHLSIGAIDQLADNFPAVRQFRLFDKLGRN